MRLSLYYINKIEKIVIDIWEFAKRRRRCPISNIDNEKKVSVDQEINCDNSFPNNSNLN